MKDMMEKLIKKNVIVFTKNKFRFQGVVQGYDGKFIELFDEIKQKPKLISVNEIIEVEVKDDITV